MTKILAVIGTIAVGVAIRFIYDFWVKPAVQTKSKEPPLGKGELKALKKAAKAKKKGAK